MQSREVLRAIVLSLILGISTLGQIRADPKTDGGLLPIEKKKLQVVYDRLNDSSEIISGWFPIAGKQVFPGVFLAVDFAANYRFAGREIKSSGNELGLLFNHSARSWTFSLHHRLIFSVDGETTDLGEGIYSTKRSPVSGTSAKSGVIESMRFRATREQFEKIAYGKQVEFQLGAFTGILTDEHKQMLRDLLNSSIEKGFALNN